MTTEYSDLTIWSAIIVIAVVTYGLRLSFILTLDRLDTIPAWFEGVIQYVPPAVFAALILPAIIEFSLLPSVRIDYDGAKLLAGGVAALVAWYTENVLATIGIGLLTLWVLQGAV